MTICERCAFVFNSEFDLTLLDYGDEYENTQTYSPAFTAYVDDLVARIIDGYGVRDSQIFEIGCGKGTFLTKVVEHEATNRGVGFDPSYLGPLETSGGRVRFVREFYGPATTMDRPDVVVCRHVIEHVPSPLEFLQSIRTALGDASQARLFFETPCVEWILRNRVVWDFFYEHCSLFTAQSLSSLFERAGFRVDSVRHVFGGQYLWLEASAVHGAPSSRANTAELLELAMQFGRSERLLTDRWRSTLEVLRKEGEVALWGAGAKGATLANLVDPSRQTINCVVDINPNKQGNYVPGTGHEIVDYRTLPQRGVTTAILMNENYRGENERLLGEAGIHVDLVQELP